MNLPKDKLRIGPLPKVEMVRITFACNTVLKDQLDRYAELHGQTYGETVDAGALIPLMLSAFMAQDQAFKRAARATQANRPRSQGSADRPAAPARPPSTPAR